jgi:FkbM family methyltransferase
MILKSIYLSIRSGILRLLPVKFKDWLKSLLLHRDTSISSTKKVQEELSSSKTYFPGLGEFDLPFSYKYFDWYYPQCELNSKRWVFENVQDSWKIIDVGANVGVYSILFGTIAKNGQVFSLEPTETFELLQQNVKYHSLSNVKEYQLGLSDTTGSISENIYKMWGKPPVAATFSISTLDDFVETLNLEELNLIKIDTDGFELEILQGAAMTLERFNPWLMIEFSYALNTRGHEVGHLLERLVELGYRNALLLDGNNLVLKKSDRVLENWSNSLNITPHAYSHSRLNEISDKTSPELLDGRISQVTVDQFFSDLFQEESNLDDVVFPLLPGRGPKMEVNDAPVLAKIYGVMNARNHLEFGTWEGFGAALFCCNSSGKATTINLPFGETSESETQLPVYSSSLYPARRMHFTGVDVGQQSDSEASIGWIYKQMGYESRVKQIFRNSLDLSAEDFLEKFDSILIDGAHDFETVIHDTKLALELLSDDGVIVWHDFLPFREERERYSSTVGVFDAISACVDDLIASRIDLYWLQDTWLLIGKRNP